MICCHCMIESAALHDMLLFHVWLRVLLHDMLLHDMLLHDMLLHDMLLHDMLLHDILLLHNESAAA